MLLMPEQFRDELLAYLANKPYREVAPAIQALQSLEPLPEPKAPDVQK